MAQTPQSLLVAAILLTLSLLALNYMVAPGCPFWKSSLWDERDRNDRNEYIIPCDLKAPTELCTPTVSSVLIDHVLLDTPFLGLVFYYCQWAFVGMFLIGSIVAAFRNLRGNVDGNGAVGDMEQQGLLFSSSGSQDHRGVS